MRKRYDVKGMTCDHCVRAVTSEIADLPGVHEVTVDLATGSATVMSDEPVGINAIRGAVHRAGYELADDGS